MVIGGSGQLSSLRDINKASAAPLCTHIRGFCKPSPQRRLLQLHVRAADKDVGENGIRPAKQQSFNNRKASGNVPRMQEAGKQQKGRAANRRPAKAKGTEGKNGTPLTAEQEAQKKARAEAIKAERFGVDEKQPGSPVDGPDGPINVDDFNPVVLGRKSRKLLDDVWKQFTNLSSPVTSNVAVDVDFNSPSYEVGEFDTPQADNTTVLVTGATGRVGRVLVRKLVLRGYDVVVLARNTEEVAQKLPSAVRVVQGDISDPLACRNAVEGVDKVVYCARACTSLLSDIKAVELRGVTKLAQELQDARHRAAAKENSRNPSGKLIVAKGRNFATSWRVEKQQEEADDDDGGLMASLIKKRKSKYTPASRDKAELTLNERNNLVFSGEVYSQGGSAQVGTEIEVGDALGNCEGLHIRVFGDGQQYMVDVSHGSGETYTARITTRVNSFVNYRLPFSAFRYSSGGAGPVPLDPSSITHLSIRYENKPKMMPAIVRPGDDWQLFSDSAATSFRLEINRIKALPGGEETDFILVSCAGVADAIADEDAGVSEGIEGNGRRATGAQLLSMKRQGEEGLRLSGLGYTIVRPGPLLEEPGGYKALVFDQGERITQGISCADVADVCLKALHDPAARNKTFEVCHEYTPERGLEQYELVAHLPDKANNYLGPALAVLEKNT